MLVEELLLGLALGVIILVHAMLAILMITAAIDDDDSMHQFFYTIIAIILMIDPIAYIIAFTR